MGEDEINKAQEEEVRACFVISLCFTPLPQDVTPKPARRLTKRLKVSPTREPTEPSPETRRRAEQIRINVSTQPLTAELIL